MIGRVTLRLRWYAGKFLNLCGFASPIRECDYRAGTCRAHITVSQKELFTIVCVNGLDIYFSRLSGQIDGVGFSPASRCTVESFQESVGFGVAPSGD